MITIEVLVMGVIQIRTLKLMFAICKMAAIVLMNGIVKPKTIPLCIKQSYNDLSDLLTTAHLNFNTFHKIVNIYFI